MSGLTRRSRSLGPIVFLRCFFEKSHGPGAYLSLLERPVKSLRYVPESVLRPLACHNKFTFLCRKQGDVVE